jgi:hypothetical protein
LQSATRLHEHSDWLQQKEKFNFQFKKKKKKKFNIDQLLQRHYTLLVKAKEAHKQ